MPKQKKTTDKKRRQTALIILTGILGGLFLLQALAFAIGGTAFLSKVGAQSPTTEPPTFSNSFTQMPAETLVPTEYTLEQVELGWASYMATCSSCHGSNTGIVGNIIGKNLRNNAFIQSHTDEELLAFIHTGRPIEDPLNTTGILMPPLGGNANLTDPDILNIIAYIRTLDNGVTVEGFSVGAVATPIPQTTAYEWVSVVNEKLDNPLNAVFMDGRLFVIEQQGYILAVDENGDFETFLDITTLVPIPVYSGGYSEQGLLGLAFHPDFENNGVFFISYINRAGDSVIARYTLDSENPNRANPDSSVILLTVDQPFEDHNGGNIVFGPDGYLYIGFGDGGRPAEPNYNSQNPQQYLGKMLRIDINAEIYSIPPDNPFVDNPDYLPEIWAMGLRNPWRFTFDRETGDLLIGDVGQWLVEEIDFQPATSTGGENYGWSAYEGSQPYLADETVLGEHTPPILEYTHDQGCSVTGGYVYRGSQLPELVGKYFFGDYCGGMIWTASVNEIGLWEAQPFMQTEFVISSFGEDENGELYLVDYKGGVYRLEAAN